MNERMNEYCGVILMNQRHHVAKYTYKKAISSEAGAHKYFVNN
jgi:hypothetical protein